MMAAMSGSAKVARETLRRGADVNTVDKFGRTAGHEAARCGHFQVLVCLGGHGCNFDVVRILTFFCFPINFHVSRGDNSQATITISDLLGGELH